MILKLDIERVRTIDEVRDFMAGSEPVDFHLTDPAGGVRLRDADAEAAELRRVEPRGTRGSCVALWQRSRGCRGHRARG